MTRSEKIVARAIARSVSHDEIVTIGWTPEVVAELDALSDGSADLTATYGYPCTDHWGTDAAGSEWRVQAVRS